MFLMLGEALKLHRQYIALPPFRGAEGACEIASKLKDLSRVRTWGSVERGRILRETGKCNRNGETLMVREREGECCVCVSASHGHTLLSTVKRMLTGSTPNYFNAEQRPRAFLIKTMIE